ncbi:hypothetical protein A0H81_13647 [Grifola frondosa]|uniref:Uncharacterized protein n=1 Tax=Grifola frondosa TaxID=5627 RepID=A0A1C7LQV9_GRIFR|nr:hypothetical protein A0H81_13647 [Grifola frondosa]
MPLSPASLMQAEIRKFWETRESSPSDYRGQRQPDEDVREYATPRRAQLKASDRISGLVSECTDDLPTDSAHGIKAHAEPSACERKRQPSTEHVHAVFERKHEPSTAHVHS